jgi:hypothetical protein
VKPRLINAALWLFPASLALNLLWLRSALDWRTPLAALAAWYLADMMSGLIHMYMDYRPCPRGAGLDKAFFYAGSRGSPEYDQIKREALARVGLIDQVAFEFKYHHPRPEVLGRRTLVYQVKSTVLLVSLPLSIAVNVAGLLLPLPGWLVTGIVVLIVGGTLSQYFHGSLHRPANPWYIHLMRRLGLLMTPQAHDVHHQTLRRDFAVINGWSNPVVNVLFAFLLQRGTLSTAGLEPVVE